MDSRRLPALLLVAYALAFAWHGLAGGMLIVDDHPGQLYRLAHVLDHGPWPWRLNPGWWAGYAELQYYPPGFAYAGAMLHLVALGTLGLEAIYQVLLWAVFVLPGAATYALLTRILGTGWLALPGAFLALTLSADSRSGVEEGLRWGLVASRLGWSLLPCLALALDRDRARPAPSLAPAVILAAIVITHPAHAPAGFLLVALAARGPGSHHERLRRAALAALGAIGLASFWFIPLLAHLEMALPLAWGDARLSTLAGQIAARPLLLVLLAAAAVSWRAPGRAAPRGEDGSWLGAFAPAMAAVIVVDAVIVQPLGILWLPADRLLDSFLLALILGASLALGDLRRRSPRISDWALGIGAIALAATLGSAGRPEPTLTLWPRRAATEWTKLPALTAGARLDDLWTALRRAPSGRILFVRSGLPLVYQTVWWRPHSHVTALAPLYAGREIVNGTFTHPAPIAGLVYTGSAAHRPITMLVEQRDGVTLFGRPLETLGPDDFNRWAARLRISAVVALDEDRGRLDFLKDNLAFGRPVAVGPFLLWSAIQALPTPDRTGAQRWRIPVTAITGGWTATGLAYSPLWRARAGDRPLEVRRDELGLLEVNAPSSAPSTAIDLVHEPGAAEWIGVALTALAALVLAGRGWRSRRARSASK